MFSTFFEQYQTAKMTPVFVPVPPQVHRLDIGTGGLLLTAKTRAAATGLAADLAARAMCKR